MRATPEGVMHNTAVRLGLLVALGGLAGVAVAAPQGQGGGQAYADAQYHDQAKPEWQRRVETQERAQRQQERDQEWQRQQREAQRRQAEAQHRSNEAWQRQNEAWQRQQEEIIRRQSERQRHEAYGYGPRHHWERGYRYGGPRYVVHDWHQYGLRTPPSGYHWVRADGDYLLIAVATGVILDIVGN